MAAPVPSYITLPDDTANTGKKVRTETRVVSGQTVHEHFYVPSIGMTVTGHYFFSSAQQTVVTAVQDGIATGFFWFQNPASSTITMVLRSLIADATAGSALATPTAPVISFTRASYTGTPSGATVASMPYLTSGVAAQVIIRTAVTGMTVTKQGDFGVFSIPSALTAIGTFYGTKAIYAKNPLAFTRGLELEVAPGELIAVWQSVAGTASDTRKFGIQMEWDEVDLS